MGRQIGEHCWVLDGTGRSEPGMLGAKGRSLDRLRSLGLPTPPAFALDAAACRLYETRRRLTSDLIDQIALGMVQLERGSGRTLGGGAHPLLVSVRPSPPMPIPGLADTILNVGINEEIEALLAAEADNADFARDTHIGYLRSYGEAVSGGAPTPAGRTAGARDWMLALQQIGVSVPLSASDQVLAAITAMFESWLGEVPERHRAARELPVETGMAVLVQTMVFGNVDETSGSGVLITRNPINGDARPSGAFLPRTQGEGQGRKPPRPLPLSELRERLPVLHEQLIKCGDRLEWAEHDMQRLEFTVQEGRLFLLQAYPARRTPFAAIRIAMQLAEDGRLSPAGALALVRAEQLRAVLRRWIPEEAVTSASLIGEADAAAPGVGIGTVIDDAETALAMADQGRAFIWSAPTVTPEDAVIVGQAAAVVLEVVDRGAHLTRLFNVPCVAGLGSHAARRLSGRVVTVDGHEGRIFEGKLSCERLTEESTPELQQLADWALAETPLQVFRRDDTLASEFGTPHTLDTVRTPWDQDVLIEAMRGHAIVTGAILDADIGIEAAVRAGVKAVVVRRRLPALVAACDAARAASPPHGTGS